MDRYWVGGTGSWDGSSTTNWSTSTGGAGGASVPTSSDNVIFDSASNATAYSVTITATANCADLTIGNPLVGAITFAGSSTLNIYGSLSLASGMTYTKTGANNFKATTTGKTLTINSVATVGNWTFDGVGGEWTLQDALNNGAWQVMVTRGSLITNNNNITSGTFASSNSNTRSITLGSSTINCTELDLQTVTGLTFDAGTSSIVLSKTLPTTCNFGALTFYNFSYTRTASSPTSGNIYFYGNCTFNSFAVSGTNAYSRVLISSNTKGTARTITAAAISVDKADFQDITGAGAASWDMSAATGYTGDCGGNSMKALGAAAFTTATTTDCSAGTTWSTATWSSRVPLPQDTATFSGSGRTITQDMPRIGSVNFAGSSGLTWTTSTTCSVFGSINLTDLATLTASTQAYTFEGRGSNTLNSAGFTWEKDILINAPGATYTLTSNITLGTTRVLTATAGTLTVVNGGSNYVISSGALVATAGTLTLGSSTHLLTGVANSAVVFNAGVNATINAGTSTLKFTNTSNTAITGSFRSFTYNNIWFDRGASTGSITISGSNTFADFKDTGTVAHSILFTTGTSQTVTTFTVSGSAGQEITINSTTTGTHALVKSGGGTISCDYLNIQHSVATPSSTWYAGTNSTNNQAVATAGSGWTFTAPGTTNIKSFNGLAYASVKSVNGLAIASMKSFNGLQ